MSVPRETIQSYVSRLEAIAEVGVTVQNASVEIEDLLEKKAITLPTWGIIMTLLTEWLRNHTEEMAGIKAELTKLNLL
jgi:hypothetical protein